MIHQTELEKSLKSNIKDIAIAYLSTNDSKFTPDNVSDSDVSKTFDNMCSDKKKITSDKRQKLDDVLYLLVKCFEDIEDATRHPDDESNGLKVQIYVKEYYNILIFSFKKVKRLKYINNFITMLLCKNREERF